MSTTNKLLLILLLTGCGSTGTATRQPAGGGSIVLNDRGSNGRPGGPASADKPDAARSAAQEIAAGEARARLWEVMEKVLARADSGGVEQLSRQEKTVAAIWLLEADVSNGGFDQYFFNGSGDLAAVAPEALREIGAVDAAAIVEEAVSVFGDEGPAVDQTERQQQMVRLDPETKKVWAALDTRFVRHVDAIPPLLQSYVAANAEALR